MSRQWPFYLIIPASIPIAFFLAIDIMAHPPAPAPAPAPQETYAMPTPYVYPIREVVAVYDGDSGHVVIDLGFDTYRKINYRVAGIDTPEVTGAQKTAGVPVRDAVRTWMTKVKYLESQSLDKYGRSLCEMYNDKGEKLTDFLLLNNLAVPYDGGDRTTNWTAVTLQLAADKGNQLK